MEFTEGEKTRLLKLFDAYDESISFFPTFMCQGKIISLLSLLREIGYRWRPVTLDNAAGGGHFEVVQWLGDHGCPWDHYSIYFAKDRWPEIAEWLKVHYKS